MNTRRLLLALAFTATLPFAATAAATRPAADAAAAVASARRPAAEVALDAGRDEA